MEYLYGHHDASVSSAGLISTLVQTPGRLVLAFDYIDSLTGHGLLSDTSQLSPAESQSYRVPL